jgi:hypothetical protein
MLRLVTTLGIVVAMVSVSLGAEVWRSDFTSGPDGVADVYNNDPGKVMIGTASGGRLPITVWDNSAGAYTPDKAGRPLGVTEGSGNSFSGLYTFNWSTYNQAEGQACDIAAFLGQASPQTRQVVGAMMMHWKVGADYYINLGVIVGGAGDQRIDQGGPSVWLGTDVPANDYKLAIGWDAGSSTATASLYAADGTLITSRSKQVPVPTPGVTDFQMTHLGWSDYTYYAGDRATVWNTDSLSFFDTFNGAFDAAIVPEPASMLLLTGGLVVAARRRKSR